MDASLSPNLTPKKIRNSSIELLKLLAIVMVVISHGLPNDSTVEQFCAINIGTASTNIQHFILGLMHNLGQIGNIIFILSSSWFLLDSSQPNIKKIAHIMGDCLIISLFMVAIFLLVGYELPLKYVLFQFFPVMLGNNWFVTCYLLFYAIHPLLNIVIYSISQKTLLMVNVIYIVLYCGISFSMGASLFFYRSIIGFIGIYFITAYFKLYMKHSTASKSFYLSAIVIGGLGWIGMNAITNILGLHIGYFSNLVMRWNTILNPFFILFSLGLFCLAKNHEFHTPVINYFSSLSLLIYIIHCNRIIRDYIRWDYFTYIFNTHTYDQVVLWACLWILITLTGGVFLAVVYQKTLQKYIHRIYDKLCDLIILGYKRVETHLLKLH